MTVILVEISNGLENVLITSVPYLILLVPSKPILLREIIGAFHNVVILSKDISCTVCILDRITTIYLNCCHAVVACIIRKAVKDERNIVHPAFLYLDGADLFLLASLVINQVEVSNVIYRIYLGSKLGRSFRHPQLDLVHLIGIAPIHIIWKAIFLASIHVKVVDVII